MKSVTRFIEEKLGLKVNAEKSKVDKPKGIKYLGFGFYFDTLAKAYKARPHPKSVAKFKAQMKKLTCRSWGVSNAYKVDKLNQLIRGWVNYFKLGSMKRQCERLDSNIAFCGAQRTPMRFRADAMRNITDTPKRLILLFSSSVGSLLCSALLPA